MAHLGFVYLAMLTRSRTDSGTNSRINLIINEGGVRKLEHTFTDTAQDDQEKGQANLYPIDVLSAGIESTRLLADGSISVGILGDDEWRPELLFLWGKATSDPPTIMPLAIRWDIRDRLSTDGDGEDVGALSSIPLRMVRTGDSTMLIRRLLLIVHTGFDGDVGGFGTQGEISDAGPRDKKTDDPIELQVVAGGRVVLQHILPDTSQDDLGNGQANVYHQIPVPVPFTRTMIDSIRLRILGSDAWLPVSVYLFGLDNVEGGPNLIIPLVHVDRWGLNLLSADASEGKAEVVLPLVPLR